MLRTEKPIIAPDIDPMDEVSEILARGALRLLIAKNEKRINRLIKLDLSKLVSNELDTVVNSHKIRR